MTKAVVDIDEQEFKSYLHTHETYLKQVRELERRMDSLAPFELAKLEFLYTKLERAAWHIAGWYKKKAKYYEGMAEIEQGQAIRQRYQILFQIPIQKRFRGLEKSGMVLKRADRVKRRRKEYTKGLSR